jgi:hypothetical protein
MGILRTIGRRSAPAGFALGVTAAAVLTAAGPAQAATIAATLSTSAGPSGGGNTVTVTATGGFVDSSVRRVAGTNLYVQFQRKATNASTCAVTYQTPASDVINVPAAGVTVLTDDTANIVVPAGVVTTGSTTTNYNVCAYTQTTTSTEALAATAAGTPYQVVPRLSVSPQSGPAVGGNTISITAPAGMTPFSAGSTYGVQFQAAAPTATPVNYCSPTWAATVTVVPATPAGVVAVAANTIGIVSGSKIVVPVPANIGASGSLGFHVCLYNNVPGTPANADATIDLIAGSGAPYTVGTPAAITSVSPSAGPAKGGNTLTVVGTGFGAGMTATLDGAPLTLSNITSTQFNAVVPPHTAGGPFKLSVTTTGGTTTTPTGVYSYSYGIDVEPNTAPNNKAGRTWISVQGVGFRGLQFTGTTGAAPNNTGAHVYLVRGAYDPKTAAGAAAGTKTNAQTAECVDVIVVADTEVVCGLYASGDQPTQASRTITGCTAVALSATSITAPTGSSTCSFSPSDVGMTITADVAGVPTNTVITAVTGTTSATISKAITTAIVATTPVFTISGARAVTAATVSTSSNTVSSTSTTGPFVSTDVGRRVTGTGIPANTFITAVASGVATLSNTPTTAGTNVVLTLTTPIPVGTYTVTVVSNGAANASTTDATYSQSIISSGSTFTVADF